MRVKLSVYFLLYWMYCFLFCSLLLFVSFPNIILYLALHLMFVLVFDFLLCHSWFWLSAVWVPPAFVFIRSSAVLAPWFSWFSLQVVLLFGHPVLWIRIKAASWQTEMKKMNTSLSLWVFTLTELTVGAFLHFCLDFDLLSNEIALTKTVLSKRSLHNT